MIIALTKKDIALVMDRVNSLISYPHAWWFKPVIATFDNATIAISTRGKRLSLKALRPVFFTMYYTLNALEPVNYWSFMVWYMDKNRPLPPGNAFDPYRQKDFERRKTEGFPTLLYPSEVPTPEATPEQQAERE